MDVHRKYSGLRFLALVIKIIAWLALIISIGLAIWFWIQGDKVAGLQFGGQNWTGVFLLPFGIYTFIQLYIIGSLISLFTDMEYNTRANATATGRLITLMEKMEQRAASSEAAVVATPPPPPPPTDSQVGATPPTTQTTPPPDQTRPIQPVEDNPPPPPPPPPEPEPVEEPEPPSPPPTPETQEEPVAPPEPEAPEAPATAEEAEAAFRAAETRLQTLRQERLQQEARWNGDLATHRQRLATLGDELRFVLITSYARVHAFADAPAEARETDVDGLKLVISASRHQKCARCWHHREDVGADSGHPDICPRCVENLGAGESREFA